MSDKPLVLVNVHPNGFARIWVEGREDASVLDRFRFIVRIVPWTSEPRSNEDVWLMPTLTTGKPMVVTNAVLMKQGPHLDHNSPLRAHLALIESSGGEQQLTANVEISWSTKKDTP